MGMERLHGGRHAARPYERNRARLQGPPQVRRVKGMMTPPGKICLVDG